MMHGPTEGGEPQRAGWRVWVERARALPRPLLLALAVGAVLMVWYGGLGAVRGGIRAEPALRPGADLLAPGGSVTVGMAGRLLQVQVEEGAFVPNDPPFYPTAFARRTAAFQAAVTETVGATVRALADDGADPDLLRAAQALETPPRQWWLNANGRLIGPSAERRYRAAREALAAFNARLPAMGSARQDLLSLAPGGRGRAAILILADTLDAEAARGDQLLRGVDTGRSRAVQVAAARGVAHAAAHLVRGIREDNADAVRASGRAAGWGEVLDWLDRVAALDPVVTGDRHLTEAGYAMLMASNGLRQIVEGAR